MPVSRSILIWTAAIYLVFDTLANTNAHCDPKNEVIMYWNVTNLSYKILCMRFVGFCTLNQCNGFTAIREVTLKFAVFRQYLGHDIKYNGRIVSTARYCFMIMI